MLDPAGDGMLPEGTQVFGLWMMCHCLRCRVFIESLRVIREAKSAVVKLPVISKNHSYKVENLWGGCECLECTDICR